MEENKHTVDEFDTFHLLGGKADSSELRELWKSRILFDWRELESEDAGISRMHPVDAGRPWCVQLDSGREVVLEEFHQSQTYAGYLEGLPPNPDIELRAAYQEALKLFPYVKRPPCVLAPALERGKLQWTDGKGRDVLEDWTVLPRIRTVALLESNTPATDELESYSSLIVIWFQNAMGLPTDSEILAKIRGIHWDSLAWDWSW